jgi:acetyl-CoA synthetase
MDAYRKLCDEAASDYEGFWARLARENLAWQKPFTKTLDESTRRSTNGSPTAS